VARVLVFAGSARREALSKRVARAAAASVAAAGGTPTLIDLADFEMPLYSGDIEASTGLPEAALRLQALIGGHDALLIASPEYNGSMTPLLLNTLDWCSRTDRQGRQPTGLAVFTGKPAALVGSSPGALGGLRALVHLRDLLGYLGMLVIAPQFTVPRANEAVDAEGCFADERQKAALDGVASALVRVAAAFGKGSA
jgi:chromate reductase, NAD(P)H dehydrogenase (quinone)